MARLTGAASAGSRLARRDRWRPARALLDAHTAIGGPGTRHSALTHLGEGGASLLMLMARSRHKKTENVRRYFHPSPEAIAEVTSLLAPATASGERRVRLGCAPGVRPQRPPGSHSTGANA
ncbi:hypothetical protein [Microbispora sp. CA-102843]|uniref:hypothetical protein n=1 Tax=Microbispora sp. CA-102843 TaxID=3239952 RepID=UPI003D8D5129